MKKVSIELSHELSIDSLFLIDLILWLSGLIVGKETCYCGVFDVLNGGFFRGEY